MNKVFIAGKVISTPELHYIVERNKYVTVFRLLAFLDMRLDSEDIEIVCHGRLGETASKFVTINTKLLIVGRPEASIKRINNTSYKGKLRVHSYSLQLFGDGKSIQETDSNEELLEYLEYIRSTIKNEVNS